ncbi:Nucleoplasmin-like domain-containing protein [Entamoeba marina]
MTHIEQYHQLVEANNSVSFQCADNDISLYIKNIALYPTKDQSSKIDIYLLKNNERTLLYKLSEKGVMNQSCLLTMVSSGVSETIEVKGKGTISLSGYIV